MPTFPKQRTCFLFRKPLFLWTVLCFFAVMGFTVPTVEAATVYLDAGYNGRPVWSDSKFFINFTPNEELCRKQYKKDWKKKCTASLGKSGTVAKGIKNIAWPEGEWEWSSSTRLAFTPSTSWKSGSRYVVDLSQLIMPPHVTLSQEQVSFTALPRSARMNTAKVWIDPSDKAEHALSFDMEFTEEIGPQVRQQLETNAQVKAVNSSGLSLGKSTWIWLDDNTRAVVNARILTLPKQKSTVKLTLPKVRPLWYDQDDNTWHFPDRDASKELVVPGTNSLFSLKKVSFEKWQNKSLQMETHLVFNFTQRVSGQELLKALSLWELPKHRSNENIIPTNWTDGSIGQEVLKDARKITPQLVQIPDQNDDFVRYRLDVSPDSYVYWQVAAGFGPTNVQGVKTPLERNLQGIKKIASAYNRIQFLQRGNIISLDSNVAVMTDNMDELRWTAYRFQDNKLAIPYISDMSETLSSEILAAETTAISGKIVLKKAGDSAKASYTSEPIFTTFLSKDIFANAQGKVAPGLVYLKLEGYRDGQYVTSTGKLFMYSNMSMVVKSLPNSTQQVYVCYVPTAKALSNVSVQVMGTNGMPIAEAKTDEQGLATLPDLSGFKFEKSPTAIVIRRSSWNDEGEDFLWMALEDGTRTVNTSQLIQQEGKQRSVNTLNAFVFAERGIFRPGDALNFGALLRTTDWELLPDNMPLLAQIYDGKWRKVYEKTFTAGQGIHSFTWDIPEAVFTGTYRLNISTPNTVQAASVLLGTRTVKIENFLPDTLRIKTSLVDTANPAAAAKAIPTEGWLVTSDKPGTTALRVQLDTLFGQVAVGRKVTSSMELFPARLSFAAFKDYTFQDVSPFFSEGSDPITRALKPGTTDGKGQAVVPLDFSQWRYGTLSCTIETQGFEPDGGRSVTQKQNFLLSPLTFMLGFKPGEGADNQDFIMRNSTAKMHFQAIGPQLQKAAPGALTFSISRRNTVTSLVTDSRGQYTFEETPVETEISQSEQVIDNEGTLTWNLPTQEVGDFVLNVKINKNTQQDAAGKVLAEGTILARVPFSIVGDDDLRPSIMSSYRVPTAKLHLKTDKKDYSGGDVAKLMLTAPYAGVALITLERDNVAAAQWVKVPAGHSLHEFPIPSSFTGRGYIQVLLGRSQQSDNIFIDAKSAAIASITVNTAKRTAQLTIDAPKKVEPGKPLQWRVENPQGKPVKAVLFAVDEGILQLSRFATPNPLHHLLLDRALEVNTKQMFDLMMAQDKKVMQRLSAFGGGDYDGEQALSLLGTFQNPFKRKQEAPVRWWSGVVDIPAGGLDMQIPIPDYYNGNIRIMAVIQGHDSVGQSESNVIVQAKQVITPQMPAMASLGDSFEAGLGLTNTTDAAVTLALRHDFAKDSATKALTVTGLPESVTLGPKEEKLLPYTVKVGQEPGDTTLTFVIVDAEGVRTERNASMSIRPAVLPRLSTQTLLLNNPTNAHVSRTLLPYKAQTSLTLSPVPLPLLQAALGYLHNYPFTCVEQNLSKAFPLVALSNAPISKELEKNAKMFSPKEKEKALKNASNALVSAFRQYEGVSPWPDSGQAQLLLTAYAADYILALRDAQMAIPPQTVPTLFNTLENLINESPDTVNELRQLAYATWVLARAGYVVSRQLELCEAFIRDTDSVQANDITHSFMAGAYAALYMHSDAQKHLRILKTDDLQAWGDSHGMLDTMGAYGMHARVLAKHFPEKFQEFVPTLQAKALEGFNKSHTTADAAMVALALIDILKAAPEQSNALANVAATCDKFSSSNAPQSQAEVFANYYTLDAPMCQIFHVNIPKGKKMYAQIQSYGYDSVLPTKALENDLRVKRILTHSDDRPFTGTVTQGEVLRVDVETTFLQKGEMPIILVDLLPGGFELVLDHKDDSQTGGDLNLFRGEDRIIAAFDVVNRDKQIITYHIRAITKGTYALPVTQAEGLYDTAIQGRSAVGKVTITAPQ